MLLDVGTVPRKHALVRLYAYMENDLHVGGCAGEIEAQRVWCNPTVMVQMFEYKVCRPIFVPVVV